MFDQLLTNTQTGKSKHYAYIEFKDEEVADIVADTMDGYLMFGRIMKCKRVPPEDLPANVWKGRYIASDKKGLHMRPKLQKTIEKKKVQQARKVKFPLVSPCIVLIGICYSQNHRKKSSSYVQVYQNENWSNARN